MHDEAHYFTNLMKMMHYTGHYALCFGQNIVCCGLKWNSGHDY